MMELVTEERASLLKQIGNTPLVEIRRIFSSDRIRIFAKLEWFNPGGSVKDRPAYNMIRKGEETGELYPGKVIVDSTSGNTGIAYALIAAAKGYKILLAMPANASLERKKILKAYGAELLLTDPLEGSDGAIRAIRELYEKSPEKYFYPDQYSNDANWKAHYASTAPEIYEQTHGEITHFVAGLGTSGTFVGASRRLKELNPEIKAISLMPDSPFHGLEGLKHMPTAMVPRIYDPSLADENLEISTEDSQKMVIRLAREEGLFAGLSSGSAMTAALRVAENMDRGTIVTIFPDGGDKYLSEEFWKQ
ncbi:cysteine synthase family protein [Acidobacteria bacterium AH-259-O06]|nr:cysteine synthase family protein [Acidobacteria bacterium AH-259-O06]